jgi:outer membrane protein TolC
MKKLFTIFTFLILLPSMAVGQQLNLFSSLGSGTTRKSEDGSVITPRSITLEEAIELALTRNLDVTISRQDREISRLNLRASKGLFDPRFFTQATGDKTRSPNVSVFTTADSTNNRTIAGSGGFQGLVPFGGGSYNIALSGQRFTTDNSFALLSPQNTANLNLTLTQPLLRGFTIDAPRRGLLLSRKGQEASELQLRLKTIETVAAVSRSYWDLVFALKNLQVQTTAVADAKKQLESNRRLVEEGQLAPVDILAAETQIANFEQGLAEAVEIVERAENFLKTLIGGGKDDEIWGRGLIPVDRPEIAPLEIPSTDALKDVNHALSNRAEISLSEIEVSIREIETRYFRNQRLPQIDLTASYNSGGIGGTANPGFSTPFPSPCETAPTSDACLQQLALLNGLTGSAFRDIWENQFPSVKFGITFTLPVGGRTGGAELGKAIVESEKARTRRSQIEQLVQMDVRNAIQGIRTAESRLRNAVIARENSEKQYASEQRKLDAGQSDVYRVLERQTAMIVAQSAELRAQTELRKAIVEYHRARGSLLADRDISIK